MLMKRFGQQYRVGKWRRALSRLRAWQGLVLVWGMLGLWCATSVEAAWFDPTFHFRVPVNVPAGASVNSTIKVDVDFAALLTTLGVSGTLDVNSPRVVRPNDVLATTQEFTDAVYAGATDATGNGRGEVRFILEDAGAATYYLYFDITANGTKAANPQTPINGNFEKGGTGTAVPPGWTASTRSSANMDLQIRPSETVSVTDASTVSTNGTPNTGQYSYLIGYRTNADTVNANATLTKTLTVPATSAGNFTIRLKPEGWDSGANGNLSNYDFIRVRLLNPTTSAVLLDLVGPQLSNYASCPFSPNYRAAQATTTQPGYGNYNNWDNGTNSNNHTLGMSATYNRGLQPWVTCTVSLATVAGQNVRLEIRTDSVNQYRSWFLLDDIEWSVVSATLGTPEASGIDHIRFEHDGAGVTCMPETITVKACADSSCSSLYAGSTTVTLSGTGWATNPVTFNGSTTVNLSITSPQTITLGTTAVAPTPTNTRDCFNGATTNNSTACQLPFADTGFIFSSIPTQVAGTTSGSLTLQAVQKSNNSAVCTGLFSGNVAIDMASQCVNPTTCQGRQVTINSTAISNNPASGIGSYTPVTLNFGANSTATFTLNYPDVGMMSLSARKLLAGSDYMTGSSNAFVVKPYGFVLSNIRQTAVPNTVNPAAVDATGAKFVKAGENFSVTVTAVNASGVATPNYGKEIVPEGVQLTNALVGGLGLTSNPALNNASAFGSFSNGVASGTTFNWDEAGIITLTPSVADGDYLGVGNVSGSSSGNVGRFYPDHFVVSSTSLTNRTDLAACAASTFTYMDEPFQVGFTLTALSAHNTVVQNYAGTFAKLGLSSAASFSYGALNGTTNLASRLDLTLPSSGSWGTPSLGSAALTGTLALKRAATPDGPFAALNIGIAPQDSDGVALLPATLDMDVDGNAVNDHAKVGTTDVRFGRLRLNNANGSELLDLPIPMKLQYWNGTGFVTNSADSCTTFAPANFTLSNYTLNLNAGETSVSIAGGLPANLKLTKPGTGNNGSVDLSLDLLALGMAYLQGAWSSTSYNQNPISHATFGVYRGANEFIYLRENY